MNTWYIDRSKNFVNDDLDAFLSTIKEVEENSGDLSTTALIAALGNKVDLGNNPNAAFTRYRDHGLIKLHNSIGDSAKLYIDDYFSIGELVTDIFVKRSALKDQLTNVRPFVLLCKLFNNMISLGIQEESIYLTCAECYEYLYKLDDYLELTVDYTKRIIDERVFDENGVQLSHDVDLRDNDYTNFSIWTNALCNSPFFIRADTSYVLVPNLKQKAFFEFVAEEGEKLKTIGISSNADLYEYYCSREYGFIELIPSVIKSEASLDDEEDTQLLFEYLFGYDSNPDFNYNDYVDEECFGVYFPFISTPNIPILSIKETNPIIADKLHNYVSIKGEYYFDNIEYALKYKELNKELVESVERRRAFARWLAKQNSANGKPYSKFTMNNYRSGLNSIKKDFGLKDIYSIKDVNEFDEIYKSVIEDEKFEDINKRAGNGALHAALLQYKNYINSSNDLTQEKDVDDIESAVEDDAGEEYVFRFVYTDPIQKICYGAPGTGKSYSVNEWLKKQFNSEEEFKEQVYRVVFHPDYSYSDFVGCIRPERINGKIDYNFVPGPFMLMLEDTFLNYDKQYYLVLEEINRGNCPAIFGDIFQLLDRNNIGKSEYPVKNPELCDWLGRHESIKNHIINGIWLPGNFNIIATMNTADQNVFTIDSAFRRRFQNEFVPIDYSILGEEYCEETVVFRNRDSKTISEVFSNNNDLKNYIDSISSKPFFGRNWPTFALIVNEIIDLINLEAGTEQISEDKKLGPYFVYLDETKDKKKFVNKVIYYLKQDVFKYNDNYFVESFSSIYQKCLFEDFDVFELLKKRGE